MNDKAKNENVKWKKIGDDNMTKTKCEVYSRVVGYIRPVQQWNDSKQAEFHDRLKFDSATAPNVKDSCGCVKLKA